jgi:O-antigen ligase
VTSVAVGAPARTTARRDEVSGWEVAFTGLALFLSLNAVVPLVFDPTGTASEVARDPVSQPAWLVVVLFTLIVAVRFHREIISAAAANSPIVCLCCLALLSAGWSATGALTFRYALELSFATVLGLYMGARLGIPRLVRITSWVMVAVLALSVVFALALPKYGLDPYHDERWRGVFTTKNELGRLMVLGGLVWAVRVFARETNRKLGSLLVIGFGLVGYESGSRTALAVAVMLVGAGMLAWPVSGTAEALIPIKGLIVTSLALVLFLTYDNQTALLNLVGADHALTGRAGIWSAVVSAIGAHLWLGYGFDAFWRGAVGPSLDVWRSSGVRTPHSHNGYLDLLLGLGTIGFAVFLAAVAIVLRRAVEALRVGAGSARTFPFLFLAVFLLYNITESSLVSRRSIDWILFVAVAAALPSLLASSRANVGRSPLPADPPPTEGTR